LTKSSPRFGLENLNVIKGVYGSTARAEKCGVLTAAAVVEEGAFRGEARHTCQGVHQEEEACQVLEGLASPGACQVVEGRQGRPCREEGRASSEEDPWVSVHKALACLVQTSAGEAQEEAASVVRPEDLVRSLEEVLVQGALASSGQEGACREEVRPGVQASDGVHIDLGAVDREVSLQE
jgi:hypothetical protein